MNIPQYKVIGQISGTNDCYEHSLLDPVGRVVARSAHPGPELKTKRKMLQEAFDLGYQIGYNHAIEKYKIEG
jgi:hypothetical protein